MLQGVTITRSEKVKDELVLDGNDVELVSRSAALINQVRETVFVLETWTDFVLNQMLFMKKIYFFYLRPWSFHMTEMPCEEQGYPEVFGWYLRQWEGNHGWGVKRVAWASQ